MKMEDEKIQKMRSEVLARLKEVGWKHAYELIEKTKDPTDISAAYKYISGIGEMAQVSYISLITEP